jgi:chromosome partitioning protein
MSTIIAVMSANDEVGKTISAINLGYALADNGGHVLLVDMDPKGTMTQTLGIKHNIGIPELIGNRLNDISIYIDDDYIVRHSKNIDCIPSSNKLSIIELLLAVDENIAKGTFHSLPGNYDYTIFDCQTGLSRLNSNIIDVADSLILPTLATIESMYYLQHMISVIGKLSQKRTNLHVNIDGILINKLDNYNKS